MPSAKRKETLPVPPSLVPHVVSDTGRFEGNDGRWSTFFINIGDPNAKGTGQTFRVLISTSSSATIVPGQTEWCDEECAKKRGVEPYNGQQPLGLQESASWVADNTYAINMPNWWTDAYRIDQANVSGVWGVDSIGLGTSSPDSYILQEQYVVKTLTKDFFMGSFGLAVGSVGPNSAATRQTFLSNFYAFNNIPSRSFGYTAGAAYRNNNNGIPGSLVLGGWDKARLAAPGTSISMPNKINNTLAVGVQAILYSKDPDVEANTESLAGSGFSATIDSTTPYLILPDDICDKFVSRFGLQFDNSSQLFLVNSSSHKTNLYQNATVSFKIGAGPSASNKFTSIVLPYEAFVQQASFPLAVPADNTQYFPIKRSENGLYVLGRTFLQEAYIIVDYERANFTVAPALFTDPMPSPSIAPIYNESYAGLQPLPPNHDSKGGLPTGAIAGIVVGIVLAFTLTGIGAFFWWRKHRKQKTKDTEAVKPSTIDTTEAGTEVKHRRVSELTGSDAPLSPKESAMGYYNPDNKSIPPISEMSPESTPAELYSPPPEGRDGTDYFAAGQMRRQGATRERGSSTVSTPIAELPGEGVMQGVSRTGSDASASAPKPPHSRSPSDSSLGTNIDTVLANDRANGLNGNRNLTTAKEDAEPAATSDEAVAAQAGAVEEEHQPAGQSNAEQRPSHNRGLSDTTIHSESTAVSQPTAEELERWERAGDDVARLMSP